MRLHVATAILLLASTTTMLASADEVETNSVGAHGPLVAYGAPSGTPEAPNDLLVFLKASRAPHGFSALAAAAGVNQQRSATLPVDLATYACVVLPVNLAFDAADKAALVAYVQGGGNLVAIGEYSAFAGTANAAMNGLAEAMGSPLRIASGFRDPGYRDTTNVEPTTLTLGVTKIRYAAYAPITGAVPVAAPELVRGADGSAFAAAQQVGLGVFTLMSDINVLSDFNGGGFANADNDVLGAALCQGAVALGVPSV